MSDLWVSYGLPSSNNYMTLSVAAREYTSFALGQVEVAL